MFIYLITNQVNGKKYIGMTKLSVEHRWYRHVQSSKRKGIRTPILLAINKYGPDNFSIKMIATAKTRAELCDKEKWYIQEHCSSLALGKGYNLTVGGDGGDTFSGRKHNAATRKKMRATSLLNVKTRKRIYVGKKHTNESKVKMSLAQKGHQTKQSTKRKISKSLKEFYKTKPGTFVGRSHSDETKLKISIANKGNKHSLAARKKMSLDRKGKSKSVATRANMVAAWARRKANQQQEIT